MISVGRRDGHDLSSRTATWELNVKLIVFCEHPLVYFSRDHHVNILQMVNTPHIAILDISIEYGLRHEGMQFGGNHGLQPVCVVEGLELIYHPPAVVPV